MRSRNNLSGIWGDSYFRVTQPFEVLLLIGLRDTGSWLGGVQILGCVYERRELAPGTEIHDLLNGVYAVVGGKAYRAVMRVQSGDAAERATAQYEEWPIDRLTQIAHHARVGGYDRRPPRMDIACNHENGIDAVLDPLPEGRR